MENSLVIFTRASQMLIEANTIQKAKELKNLALTAADWARRKGMGEEAIQHCRSYALEAERKLGEMLAEAELQHGARGIGKSGVRSSNLTPTLTNLGLTKWESFEAQILASISKAEFEELKLGEKTRASIRRELKRKETIERLENLKAKQIKKTEGVFDVIVVDPPWPMKKIEREVRPNQSEMDYPTMTEEEISNLEIPSANDCHLWLWTTHKFLPSALNIIEKWGFTYICVFVWHKPGGFQPIDLPQYNCEFVLYARKGSPKFIDTKNFNVCFSAPRNAHSEKPEEFYLMVRRVTAGRRFDMFSRREIEGFEAWGLEAK
ncbi:MAG: MT-A70 family methyltransferase [Thermodesulfobacteriota bacterium]|nr:MT-A70 family methyltransferase [Thermodesulfobacteriota bacterium]